MGERFAMVVFHDAEDLVDPAGLGLLDVAIARGTAFAQLPVEPIVQRANGFQRRHLGSHYCEEFDESHGKAMVVRDALGAALPAAGVGCAFARASLELLCERADERRANAHEGDTETRPMPFDADSLTEDYELGLAVAECGGACRFVRARGEDGRLIATRALFPARLETVVRQKTRWIHGIALQGWDRVAWTRSPLEIWMRGRDRRGPLTALVLSLGYVLLVLTAVLWGARAAGLAPLLAVSPLIEALLVANLAAFAWRAAWRLAFTASVHGLSEGLRAVLRIPLANRVAILAGRRAVTAYAKTLAGRAIEWDKTPHESRSMNEGLRTGAAQIGIAGSAPRLAYPSGGLPARLSVGNSRPSARNRTGSDAGKGLAAS